MADWLPCLGAACGAGLVVALVAWAGEWRRKHRKNLDAVGFMPWTSIAFWAMMVAILAGVLAARLWWAGGEFYQA